MDSNSGAGISRLSVMLALPLTILTGNRRLSDLVLRKILLIITELAINTTASPRDNLKYLEKSKVNNSTAVILIDDGVASSASFIIAA